VVFVSQVTELIVFAGLEHSHIHQVEAPTREARIAATKERYMQRDQGSVCVLETLLPEGHSASGPG
jgi:hypothetical protein